MPDQDQSAAASVDELLAALWEAGGTDLHLTVGLPPQLRIHGELSAVPNTAPLTVEDLDAAMHELATSNQRAALLAGSELDFSFSWRDTARVRGNAFRQRGSTALALRMIPRRIPTMAELGLPPILGTFAHMQQGLVLVTGPTGSGKSTTLASMIDQINTNRACHIITIEDPIEYVHDHKRSAVNQREVGTDTASFAGALRSALREDPDVLLVGEMRDLESIQFALTIAETGHLVFATLHTNDTAQSLARIIDVFPGRPAGADPGPARRLADRRRVPAADPADRRRHGRRLRGDGRRLGGPQPDQGGQDPPAAQRAGHRAAGRHDHLRAVAVGPGPDRRQSATRTPSRAASTRARWNVRCTRSRGMRGAAVPAGPGGVRELAASQPTRGTPRRRPPARRNVAPLSAEETGSADDLLARGLITAQQHSAAHEARATATGSAARTDTRPAGRARRGRAGAGVGRAVRGADHRPALGDPAAGRARPAARAGRARTRRGAVGRSTTRAVQVAVADPAVATAERLQPDHRAAGVRRGRAASPTCAASSGCSYRALAGVASRVKSFEAQDVLRREAAELRTEAVGDGRAGRRRSCR